VEPDALAAGEEPDAPTTGGARPAAGEELDVPIAGGC
jgi:hypothetical protein